MGIAKPGLSKEHESQGSYEGCDSDVSDSQLQKNTERSIRPKQRDA